MRKVGLTILATLAVACGGNDNTEKGTPKGDPCTAAQADQRRCDGAGSTVQKCDGTRWVNETVCNSPQVCQADGTQAKCVSPKAEFDMCSGTGQGDCGPGLACRSIDGLTGTDTYCFTPCDPSGTNTCTGGVACAQVSDTATDGICSTDPPSDKLNGCFGVNQGSCATDLQCIFVDLLGGAVCGTACDGSTPSLGCSTDEYCQAASLDNPANGLCWAVGNRGDNCLPLAPNDACADVLTCDTTGVGIAHECIETCDAANIGTTTGCSADTCLGSLQPELERAADKSVPCSTLGTDAACSVGYTCQLFPNPEWTDTSSPSTAKYCAKTRAECAKGVDLQVKFAAADLKAPRDAYIAGSANTLCGMPDQDQLCSVPATGDIAPTCAATLSAFTYFTDDIPCDPANYGIECAPYGLECLTFSDGSKCAASARYCVDFCEDITGALTGTCPDSTACGVPESFVGDLVYQNGGPFPTAADSCPTNTCDAGAGFACDTNGFCSRNRKVCISTL